MPWTTPNTGENDAQSQHQVTLPPIGTHDAILLKGKKLDAYLKQYGISRSGTACEKRFKLQSFLRNISYTDDEKSIIRNAVIEIVGTK